MGKKPVAPGFFEALGEWEDRRRTMPEFEDWIKNSEQRFKAAKKALRELLDKNRSVIWLRLSETISNNVFASRAWVNELVPDIREFWKKYGDSLLLLDVLREWFQKDYKDYIRVEGDPAMSGYFVTWGLLIKDDVVTDGG